MNTVLLRSPRPLAFVLGLALLAGHVPAADPPAAPVKADFATLDALLAKGDYAEAVTAADTIAATVRPKPRADDFLDRSIELIKALMRRGVAELRLGRIAAAKASFTEAHRTFKDPDFRRLVVVATRQAGPRLPPAVVDLELTWLELLFLRETVVIETLKTEATRLTTEDAASPERDQEVRKRVEQCLDDLKGLRKAAVDARESFGERFTAASGLVPVSPYAWSLAGPFRETLLDGLAASEQSRLPVAVLPADAGKSGKKGSEPAAAAAGAGDGRTAMRAIAIERLEATAAALADVVAAVTPKAGGLRPEVRADLAALEAELLTARAQVRIEAGEPAAARKDLDKVLELHREIGLLRKNPNPDMHPDLAQPLLLAADVRILESRRLLGEGAADMAKVEAEEAERKLERVTGLLEAPDHPLHARLAMLRQQLDGSLRSIKESIPRSDAIEAAARRMIRAIEAAPLPPQGGRSQRPSGEPAAQESGGRSPASATRST